ncbi:transposase zinc-binding domain-containing protein [Fusobacterium varium]|jgi:hypothetical protein|uniref:Transposase zinc-binding domain-containing protein n=1 Tax=Fusobacterium varium ATCC 27725 TaxID=469618 RepID=A0ABN5JJI7_FUSVA|nr:hypothetical protein C4N18_08150 [Fusobacterium varium ATCC 27725]
MQIKHIISKINITNLLGKIKKYFKNDHFENIKQTFQKFLACSIDNSFLSLQCPNYHSTHKIKVTCKSRFCPSYRKRYSAL